MLRPLIALATLALLAGCEPPQTPDEDPLDPAAMPETSPVGFVDEGPDQAIIIAHGEVQWQDGPGSLDDGAEFSVLEGDPGSDGLFTMRIRMPDGFRINPHTHPGVERLTVISGTFHLGHGEEFDRDATTALPAGSYFSLPPGHAHYAEAGGETVVQLSSIGPWEIEYINPEHDPRM